MLFAVTSIVAEAAGPSHLLHKHPNRAQSFEPAVGIAHVIYLKATDERRTIAIAAQRRTRCSPIAPARDHACQLSVADAVAERGETAIGRARRIEMDLQRPSSEAVTTTWREELTGAGGEVMVVKRARGLARGTRSVAQPGTKVRGA